MSVVVASACWSVSSTRPAWYFFALNLYPACVVSYCVCSWMPPTMLTLLQWSPISLPRPQPTALGPTWSALLLILAGLTPRVRLRFLFNPFLPLTPLQTHLCLLLPLVHLLHLLIRDNASTMLSSWCSASSATWSLCEKILRELRTLKLI